MVDEKQNTDFRVIDSSFFSSRGQELLQLYLLAFTSGELAQHISPESAGATLKELLQRGSGVAAIRNEKITGAILGMPLGFDRKFPDGQHPAIPLEKTVYIAELMVHPATRGQGVASELMAVFLENEKTKGNTDAVIRVWNENKGALHLYRKQGFTEIASIIQKKIKPDGVTRFQMNKIYLHKKLE
ncbi:MAG: GCN5-related N-acetyltransferase [Bacteroidetes bacterium]|nr:GCN5-related N-acetyltransferase [Bacteroidota bacterium]